MSSSRTNFSDSEYRVKSAEMGSCVDCKTTSCKNRSYPGLLRLNSTGEISSAKPGYRSKVKKNQPLYQSCSTDSNNLNKNQSVMNSIGAYIGSAAAYLGSFYPPNTLSKGLMKNSTSCGPTDCIQGFLMSDTCSSEKTMHSVRPEDSLNLKNLHCSLPVSSETDKTMHWTENIFGVIHSSLMSNCTSNKNIINQHPEVQKYVPPQRRCGGVSNAKHHSTTVDPKLTPYNARLFKKSKQSLSDGQKSFKEGETCPSQVPVKSKSCRPAHKNLEPPVMRKCENVTTENAFKPTDLTHSQNLRLNECVQSDKLNDSDNDGHTADVINNNDTGTTDWFEYDNRPSESVLNTVTDNCVPATYRGSENVSYSQGVDCSIKQLRNWYSVENDKEMKDKVEAKYDSSQTSESPQSICDNHEIVDNAEVSEKNDCFPELQEKEPLQDLECPTVAGLDENVKRPSVEQKDINAKVVNHSAVKEALFAALYIRNNCGKRNRPSAKKRRRHKAQQIGESSDNSVDKQTESKNSLNASSAHQPSSIVAFILGNDSDDDDDEGCHTVRFHCNFDSDSDWSDNDSETDENLSSLDDELQASDLGFRSTDPLMFRMTCSVQSSTPATCTQEDDPNSIDKINMMWKVQVSVESELPRKSKCTKQVHFAESKSLATVHPMVTWCHAYQAARKGPWEQYARDRARFMRRVKEAETVLKPFLHQKHRERIYNDRYAAKS